MVRFHSADGYIVRIDGDNVQASNGTRSFSGAIDPERLEPYLAGLGKDSVQIAAAAADSDLELTFFRIYKDMQLDPVPVRLAPAANPVEYSAWLVELMAVVKKLETQVEDQATQLKEMDAEMEQMVVAKETYQQDILERVSAVLESRDPTGPIQHDRPIAEELGVSSAINRSISAIDRDPAIKQESDASIESIGPGAPGPFDSDSDATTGGEQ